MFGLCRFLVIIKLASLFSRYCSSFFFFSDLIVIFIFFFSSRRRHTRCSPDWSSDVCSSDLSGSGGSILGRDRARVRPYPRDRRRSPTPFAPDRVAREHITKASQRQARFSRRVVAP